MPALAFSATPTPQNKPVAQRDTHLAPLTNHLPAGEYFLPGELLRLPSQELGIAVKRLYFNDPGTEFALAFLCPTLPPCITPANPIQAVSEQAMHTMLQALLQDSTTCLAHTLVKIAAK